MLTKINRNIQYLIIFLVAFSLSILLIRQLATSSDKFIFISIIITISFFIFWKPKKLFLLSVGGAILFYDTYLQETLFYLGNAKVYAQDLFMVAMMIYLFVQLICKYRRDLFKFKSTIFFVLYFLLGLLSIIRGFPRFGFSAIGESRWYVLIILFYFFILFTFHQKKDVLFFLKWMAFFIAVMIIKNFTIFFFSSGDFERVGRKAYRFIYSTETLLISFLLVFLILLSLYRQMKLASLWLNLILFFLLSIIVIVQIRSVWLATIGGLVSVYIFTKKISSKILVTVCLTIFILFIFAPIVN